MAKAARTRMAPEDISRLAVSIFDKVRQIKRDHPDAARSIDRIEREIRHRLEQVRTLIARIPDKRDRDLVTILVINGLHRTADEVLIDHSAVS